MSPDTLLGVYHFCNLYHGGQWSREYRILCRVMKVFRPSHSEEFVSVLLKDGYEVARTVFESLVRSHMRSNAGENEIETELATVYV